MLILQITKRKQFELLPMTDAEAIEAMELLGNTFYVYLDKKSGQVKVAYARNDGDFGVIETTY